MRDIEEPFLLQQPKRVLAAAADRPAPCDRLQRARGLQQMVALQRRILRHVVLPHVVGDLVPAAYRRAQRLRIELADPARREDRRLDAMRVEQLDQPPDADAPAELALGKLHRRLVQQPAQQHGVEIGGEVHGDPRVAGPGQIGDALVARIVALRRRAQVGDLLFELAGHRLGIPSTIIPIIPRVLTSRVTEPHSPAPRDPPP